jgi:enamine deaminase RidA (YjgF/YER057c/UK114 family)
MSKRVITSPNLPAPMRGGAYSAGVEAPTSRTVYVSGQVSIGLTPDERTIFAYATVASSIVACSCSVGLR